MICSSVNRFLFIVRLHLLGRTLNLSEGNLQWQLSPQRAVRGECLCMIGLGASAGGEADRGNAAARAERGMKTSGAGGLSPGELCERSLR